MTKGGQWLLTALHPVYLLNMPSGSPVSVSNPLKRARVDDGELGQVPSALTQTELHAQIRKLSRDELEGILLDLAPTTESVASAVKTLVEKKEAAERARVHDFDHYSKSAWYAINKKHDRKSGSKQYEAGYEVAHDIEDMFKTMSTQTHAHSPLATKRSALETMRKILKSICLHNSEVGRVVMNNIYGQMDCMIAVARCFNAEDVRQVAAEGLLDRIEELEQLAKQYCVFEELNEVLDIVSARLGVALTSA